VLFGAALNSISEENILRFLRKIIVWNVLFLYPYYYYSYCPENKRRYLFLPMDLEIIRIRSHSAFNFLHIRKLLNVASRSLHDRSNFVIFCAKSKLIFSGYRDRS